MRIGNKLFPYPTINNSKNASCFKNSSFVFDYEEVQSDTQYILKDACIKINNNELINLVNTGKIVPKVVIECSSTVYRECFDINMVPHDIVIPITNLRDKVVISCFVYAAENFKYTNDDFLDFYEGYTFDIEKYDIIAIDDGFTTRIDYDESKDKKVSSIFSIIRDESIADGVMKIEAGVNKVILRLPETQFNCYMNMKNNDIFQDIFFSILTIPALTYVLQSIKDRIVYNDETFDDIKIDYIWFESIEKAYEKEFNAPLTEDIIKNIFVPELAQKLMNTATTTAIIDLFKLGYESRKDGLEDE